MYVTVDVWKSKYLWLIVTDRLKCEICTNLQEKLKLSVFIIIVMARMACEIFQVKTQINHIILTVNEQNTQFILFQGVIFVKVTN